MLVILCLRGMRTSCIDDVQAECGSTFVRVIISRLVFGNDEFMTASGATLQCVRSTLFGLRRNRRLARIPPAYASVARLRATRPMTRVGTCVTGMHGGTDAYDYASQAARVGISNSISHSSSNVVRRGDGTVQSVLTHIDSIR